MNSIVVRVVDTYNNEDEGNLPSRYCPGAGSSHGWFQLEKIQELFPSHAELSWALRHWNDDCILMDYDRLQGKGRFVMVDWYAPAPGTIIELNAQRDYK